MWYDMSVYRIRLILLMRWLVPAVWQDMKTIFKTTAMLGFLLVLATMAAACSGPNEVASEIDACVKDSWSGGSHKAAWERCRVKVVEGRKAK